MGGVTNPHPNPMFDGVDMDQWAAIAWNMIFRKMADGGDCVLIQSKRTRFLVKKWLDPSSRGKVVGSIEEALRHADYLASKQGGWQK